MADKTGVARLRQAIENQMTCGSGQFELSIDSADKLCREIEDELARLSWAAGVPVPRDADGKVVPLDTVALYTDDGEMIHVSSICFNHYCWYIKKADAGTLNNLNKLHRTQPDSWELLEENILTLAKCKFLTDPEGDAKKCIRRAKALAKRDAKEANRD